ncbi:MAG: NADH-quinone oxidoreductase subunit L [Candidatus Wallbacteria bacterium]
MLTTIVMLILCVPFVVAILIPLLEKLGLSFLREGISVFTGFLIAVLSLMLITHVKSNPEPVVIYNWMPGVVSFSVMIDSLAVMLAGIAGVIGSLIVFYSMEYMKGEEGLSRYYSLVLFFIASMTGLVLSDNLIFLYIFWEMIGIASYLLIGFFYKQSKAANAGFKAFLTTKIGDCGLLCGILTLYAATGTLNISELVKLSAAGAIPSNILFYSAVFFIAGAVGKSAQVPLHVWLPDAMEAPTTISALIHAATLVNSGIYLIARMYPVFLNTDIYFWLALNIGMVTALLVAALALFEADLKKVLAYSTVSQLGFMMYALGVHGYFAAQFHLFSHAIFKALLFLCAGALIHYTGTRNMHEMTGRGKDLPALKWCMAIGFMALAGIPIFNGFWSKDLIISTGYKYDPLSASLMLLAALFTAGYSFKAFYILFMKSPELESSPKHSEHHSHAPGFIIMTPLMILALFTIVSWLLIGNIADMAFNSLALSQKSAEMQFIAGEMTLSKMIHHTVSSPITYAALIVIALGVLLYYKKGIFSKILNERSIRYAFSQGLYFDWLYLKFLSLMVFIGRLLIDLFDRYIFDNINYAAGACAVQFSTRFRKTHSGNLSAHLAGIMIALAAIFFIVKLF